MAKSKFDVYDHVTDQIITQIAAGTPPWRRPWTGGAIGAAMPLRWNSEAYRGINVVMLWAVAAEQGYVSNRWLTYRQAQDLGGQVTKGQKSSTVVKYGTFDGEKESSSLIDPTSAATDARKIGYCRAYRVFNADQIEGLDKAFYVKPEPPRDLGTKADAGLDAFFAATGAEMETSAEPRAYYGFTCRRSRHFMTRRVITAFRGTSLCIGRGQSNVWTDWAALQTARLMLLRNWWQRSVPVCLAPILAWNLILGKVPRMSKAGRQL